jgi:hypothetical protein
MTHKTVAVAAQNMRRVGRTRASPYVAPLAAPEPFRLWSAMAGVGHEDPFPPIRLSGRCRASQETSPAREINANAPGLNSAISLGRSALSATSQRAATTKGLQGRWTVMITVSHREGPDPYGVDP